MTGAGARRLSVLAFEAGRHLLAVPAEAVERIAAPGDSLAEGTTLFDAAGLLAGEEPPRRGCLVVLRTAGEQRPVAIIAGRAQDVRSIDPERLLPLPGFLFRGVNPFLGLAAPEHGLGQAIFVLASPQRLLSLRLDP